MVWQLHQPANVNELQVSFAQSGIGVRSAHADVVVHPEGNVAAEVARSEEAEETGLEIGGRDVGRHSPWRQQRAVPVTAAAGVLEVVVVTQPDWGDTGNAARPDRLRPKLGIGWRAQHYRRNFDHRAVVLEGLAEVIQLGEVDVTRAATGAVHA